MCGIFAYTGPKCAAPILLEGLKRLEHRGYDSAGLAIANSKTFFISKKAYGSTSVDQLTEEMMAEKIEGTAGVAHTRWATHGIVNEQNAHPQVCDRAGIAIIHNGIIENYPELKEQLLMDHVFLSDTDSEVLAHLIGSFMEKGVSFERAVTQTASKIRGAGAFVAIHKNTVGLIAGAKIGRAGGIVIAQTGKATFIVSEPIALPKEAQEALFLDEGEVFSVTSDNVSVMNPEGRLVQKETMQVRGVEYVGKEGYPYFMEKEIEEQPKAVLRALGGRFDFSTLEPIPSGFPIDAKQLKNLRSVMLIGMGSSLIAAKLAAFHIETFARVPASFEHASEFTFRNPPLDKDDLLIVITQSGETADTLAALEVGIEAGANTMAIVENTVSHAAKAARFTLPINAGMEICVAATKTLTNTIASLLSFAAFMGSALGTISRADQSKIARSLILLPNLMLKTLDDDLTLRKWAREIAEKEHLLYLARGAQLPIAMEGALKMKEVAYIHAEACSAAEMKHGTNALISESMPTIAIVQPGPSHSKMISSISEIKARSGRVYALAEEGDKMAEDLSDYTAIFPHADFLTVQPFLTLIQLQKLAYFTALHKGLNPDRPRHLAKTVTVD